MTRNALNAVTGATAWTAAGGSCAGTSRRTGNGRPPQAPPPAPSQKRLPDAR
jgi:hypothetical protein